MLQVLKAEYTSIRSKVLIHQLQTADRPLYISSVRPL